jgi:hypothetical protein
VIDSKAGWTENASMKLELPLAEMSLAEKLAAMEALWADLARHAGELASPEWHAEILKERGRCLAAGEEEVLDWEEAKRRLRREIQSTQRADPGRNLRRGHGPGAWQSPPGLRCVSMAEETAKSVDESVPFA